MRGKGQTFIKKDRSFATFLLVKPDGMRYIDDIRDALMQRNLKIQDELSFDNWSNLAYQLYKLHFEKEDPEFRANFELHIWLQMHLFGSQGRVFILKPLYYDLEQDIAYIRAIRDEIRNFLFQKGDNRIIFMLNTSLFNQGREASGFFGKVGICQGRQCVHVFEDYREGKWDLHFFKYVHAPDSVEEFLFQTQILMDFSRF